jgi:CheY-like chemotaxis protein
LRNLLLLLTAIGFLPLVFFGAWGIKAAADYQRHELERSMLDLSRALSSAVDAELDGWVSTLRTMANNPALVYGDMQTFYDVAREQVRNQSDWSGVVLTDAAGAVVFKTVLPFGSQDGRVVDPESLRQAMALRTPVVGRISQGQVAPAAFPVRVPVTDAANHQYVLTAAIQPSRILKVMERQRSPAGWVISVHDSSGRRVARSLDHAHTVGTRPSPSLERLLQSERMEGVGDIRTQEGIEAVAAYTKLSRYAWTVVVGAPTEELRHGLWRSVAIYSGGIVASLALCMLLAALIARRAVSAMAGLQEQAVRLGRGEAVQIQPSGIYEVNLMGMALEAAGYRRTQHVQERNRLLASLEQALRTRDEALARAEIASRANADLPATAEPSPRSHAVSQDAAPRPRRVLVVDDNKDAAHGLQGVLELDGHEVRTAHTAQEAMALFAEFAPEVGVINIGLPDMNGYQLAALLRREAAGRPLRLIALAGHGQQVQELRKTGAGFDQHLNKPAEVGALLAAIAG